MSIFRLADVYVYFLRDDSTESVAGSNGAKYYVTQSEARGAFTSDPGGQPNAVLSGQSLSVCLSVCLCLSVFVFVSLTVPLSMSLSLCLSVRLSVCLMTARPRRQRHTCTTVMLFNSATL